MEDGARIGLDDRQYDKDTKTVYWGVGNAAPWPGSMHAGDNLYTSSVLALDPETGKIKTHFQYHQNDSWDWGRGRRADADRPATRRPFVQEPDPSGRDAIFWVLENKPDKINYVAAGRS